jgi:hypothetical protein
MNDDFGIWPPHEAFYLESMLLISSSAVASAEKLSVVFGMSHNMKILPLKTYLIGYKIL